MAEVHGNRTHQGRSSHPPLDLKYKMLQKGERCKWLKVLEKNNNRAFDA